MPKKGVDEEKNPIEKRAWAFQERELSHRVLYYGFRGLSYFCSVTQVGDRCHGERITIEDDLSGLERMGWHESVEEYSKRQMFDPAGNKFNAISAVAREHGKGTQYVAGLWKNRLASDLAWFVVPNRGNKPLHPPPQLLHGHGLPSIMRSSSGVMATTRDAIWTSSTFIGLLSTPCKGQGGCHCCLDQSSCQLHVDAYML